MAHVQRVDEPLTLVQREAHPAYALPIQATHRLEATLPLRPAERAVLGLTWRKRDVAANRRQCTHSPRVAVREIIL